jgi:hypothetical protein
MGAAYGTAKSGIGIAGVATFRPDLVMKCLIPIIMSGILSVYSLVVGVLITQDLKPPPQSSYTLFRYGQSIPKSLIFLHSRAIDGQDQRKSCSSNLGLFLYTVALCISRAGWRSG